VAAVIVSVVHRMGSNVIKGWREGALALAAALALLLAPQALRLYVTLSIVCGFGAMGYWMFRLPKAASSAPTPSLPWARLIVPLIVLALLLVLFLAQPALDPNGLPQIALTFSGLSLMLFGGGYVFIPMIQDVVVSNYAWLTTQQFLDGIAFSQVTPGPILVIATFIAQKVTTAESGLVLGIVGALVGTVAIFAPPAMLMVTASLALEDIKQSPVVQAAMRGIRCGILGMIAVAAVVILRAALPTWPDTISATALAEYAGLLWPTAVLFAAALVAMMKYRLDVAWVIPAAGRCGLAIY
jgi:chromate transporter